MAMVYLTKHTENIYNIENIFEHRDRPSTTQQGRLRASSALQPSYISKFRPLVQKEEKSRKADHKSMGYANTPLASPSEFLKKGAGIRCKSSTEHKCVRVDMPPVPRHNEVSRELPSKESAVKRQNMKSAPASIKRQPRYGCGHGWVSVPQYVFKPNFGKVPNYILKIKEKAKLAKQEEENKCEEDEGFVEQPGTKYLSQNERYSLLSGLKANWEKLQKRYQSLPVLTDTESKRATKSSLEKQLKQLEKDILLLENNQHIYISDN